MVQGLETREVVAAAGPNGQANQPARQLGLVNVQAPRGGSARLGGDEIRDAAVLSQAMELGGQALGHFIEKKREDDLIMGEMDYAEGKTEADLNELGVSRSRMQGFQALKLKTGYNQWFTQQVENIEKADHALSTEDYKAKLHGAWRELADTVSPQDRETRRLLASLATDGFGKLVSGHVGAHAAYSNQESLTSLTNLLHSEAQTGDNESLNEVLENFDELAPNLSGAARKAAVSSALRQTLQEGNFTLWDELGQEAGLRKRGYSEDEMTSIKNAYKVAQTMQESTFAAEIDQSFNDLMLDVKTEGLGREEAIKRLQSMKDEYRLSDSYWRGRVNEVSTEIFGQDLDERTAAMIYDPQYIQDKAALMRQVGYDGIESSQGMNKALKLAEKYDLSHDIVMKDLEAVAQAHSRYESRKDAQLDQLIKKQEAAAERDRRSTAILNSNFGSLQEYSAEEQQHALDMKKDAILQEVSNNPRFDTGEEKVAEVIRQHVSFLREVPIRDKAVKQEFSVIAQSSPLAEDGTLREEHMQAYQYLAAMREAGLSERTIKEYAGDSYEYLSTAFAMSSGTTDPTTALTTSYEMTSIPTEDRPTPRTDVNAVMEDWDKTKADYFDEIEPSMVASWLGAESDAKYDEVLTYQVKEAAKNSADMDRWFKRRVDLHAKAHPNMRKEAVMELAKKDLSQWEYVMGNMVPPKDGKTLTQAMGLDTAPGALRTNSAMLMYMRDNADLLFPEGTEQAGWWNKFKSGAGDALDTAIFQPETIKWSDDPGLDKIPRWARGPGGDLLDTRVGQATFSGPGLGAVQDAVNNPLLSGPGLGTLQNLVMATSEKEQRLANDIKMIDVTPLSNGQVMVSFYQDTDREELVGIPLAIPARDIGDWYKEKTKQDALNKNLPRR